LSRLGGIEKQQQTLLFSGRISVFVPLALQGIRLNKLREQPHPSDRDDDRSNASHQYDGHDPEHGGSQAGLKLPHSKDGKNLNYHVM
jgi:hypothetical protein